MNKRRTGPTTQAQGHILRSLLDTIRLGMSRETLLNWAFDLLESRQALAADFLVLVEGYSDPNRKNVTQVKIRRVIGAHLDRVKELEVGFSRRWKSSGLLENVLLKNYETNLLLNIWPFPGDYDGEFWELHGKKNIWISALPLPSGRPALPERGIFAIYLTRESGGRFPKPPGGDYEWTILQALSSIYSLVDHRLNNIAEEVAKERRELIMELAPRAINHEIGTHLSLMKEVIGQLVQPLKNLRVRLGNDDDDLEKIGPLLLRVQNMQMRVSNIAEAFNNIEKRNPRQKTSVKVLINEACGILEPLFSRFRIRVDNSRIEDIVVRTNATLVQHVVLNVLYNAVEAIEDESAHLPSEKRPWREVRIDVRQLENDDVEVIICNNGPEIPPELGIAIFEKGVTTRGHGSGHGQGLYLCRLVAAHLEGEFDFGPSEGNPMPGKPCFRFVFPSRLQHQEDMHAGRLQGN